LKIIQVPGEKGDMLLSAGQRFSEEKEKRTSASRVLRGDGIRDKNPIPRLPS